MAKVLRQYELIERNMTTDDDFELRTNRSSLLPLLPSFVTSSRVGAVSVLPRFSRALLYKATSKEQKMITANQESSSYGIATEDSAQYLDELVKDMRELYALPGAHANALRLLNEEIDRVWCVLYPSGVTSNNTGQPVPLSSTVPPSLFSPSSTATSLYNVARLGRANERVAFPLTSPRTDNQHENIPSMQRMYTTVVGSRFDPSDGGVTVQEKIPIPYYPRCNFIGRILGPRGISVKQIESETGCCILIRGKGSVKDPVRELRLIGLPGWEHLAEPLHVLIKATDVSQALAEVKLRRGVQAISQLLTPHDDEHKKRQLVQLAIINGTFRCDDVV